MKYNILLLACLFAFSPLSLADDSGSGFYGGVGFGISAFEDKDFVKVEQPYVQTTVSKSDRGTKLYFGYQMDEIVGFELGYTDYGSFTAEDYVHTIKGIDISFNVGYTFVEGTLRPYLIVGMGYVFNEFPHDKIPSLKLDHLSSHIGLGLDYTPIFASGFGLRIAFERNGYTYSIVQSESVETNDYKQVVGLLYLGVHYKY